MSMSPTLSSPNPEDFLRQYDITETLAARGSMSVFRARRTVDGPRVVLKVLRDAFPRSEDVANFQNACEIGRRLNRASRETVRLVDQVRHDSVLVGVWEDVGGSEPAGRTF